MSPDEDIANRFYGLLTIEAGSKPVVSLMISPPVLIRVICVRMSFLLRCCVEKPVS